MVTDSETAAERVAKCLRSLADKFPDSGGATEAWRNVDDVAYALSQISLFTPRPIKIIAIGAGFAGLEIAHAVESGALPGAELVIYEKDSGIGGTWFENRYPGYVSNPHMPYSPRHASLSFCYLSSLTQG